MKRLLVTLSRRGKSVEDLPGASGRFLKVDGDPGGQAQLTARGVNEVSVTVQPPQSRAQICCSPFVSGLEPKRAGHKRTLYRAIGEGEKGEEALGAQREIARLAIAPWL